MNKPISVVVAGLAVMLCAGGACAGLLSIVDDGQPRATIVVADDAGFYPRWAAQRLSDFVKKAAGATLPIVAEANAPAGTLISVGHTKMAAAEGITTDDLKYDGCKLVVKGMVLYLIGRDTAAPDATRARPDISCAQGTVRAVAMFLEDVVGVRWLALGPHGTAVPTKRDITVAGDPARTFVPAVAYCRGRSPYRTPMALYANNFRVALKYKAYGGHSWEVHVDDREYFDEHPEYFALLPNGERSRATYSEETGLLTRNAHLCTSNMDVRRIIVDKMRALFDEGYDMVQLGQSDGWAACVCDACMRMDSHLNGTTVTRDRPCEKIWLMHKWILDELYQSHPDKFVNVLVYGPTGWPSKQLDSLPPNAVMEMAPINEQRLDAWRGKIKYLTTYMYWFDDNCQKSGFVPPLSPQWLQKTLRRYRDIGVMGIKGTPRINWGLGGPSYYAYGKLIGDPDTDVDRLLNDYCVGIYAESGPAMKRFFRLFHSRSSKTMELPYFPGSYHAEDAFTTLYPPKIVHELDRLLALAEGKATSDQARGWVKHTRDCFDGLRTVAEMFTAKRAFEAEPSRESLLRLQARVEAVEDWRERILSYDQAYTEEWFPDYLPMAGFLMTGGFNSMFDEYYYNAPLTRKHVDAFQRGEKKVRGTGMGGNLGHHDISAPITWDFDRVMATLGDSKREAVIEVVPAPAATEPDGRVGPEWDGVEAHPLVGFYSEADRIFEGATTTVRVMYDEKQLLVAYECIEPNIDKLRLANVGRDGNVYGHDEVELFLNVDETSDRKVMQFAASPVEDAFFDARRGFITDPLDPNFNAWNVVSWNPDWRYAYHIDKAAGQWTLEMALPYAGLGADKPEPGTEWTGNFGRCRRVHGSEDLSSWIPGTFGSEPALFGKLVFVGAGASGGHQAGTERGAPSAPGVSAVNCAKNASFEVLDDGGAPVGWRLSSYLVPKAVELLERSGGTAEAAHSGQRSMKLDCSGLDVADVARSNEVLLRQSLDGAALKSLRGQTIVFSMWLRYDSLCAAGKSGYFPGPWFDLTAYPAEGDPQSLTGAPIILNRPYFAPAGYVSDGQLIGQWLRVETRVDVPVDTETLRVRIGMQAARPWKDTVALNPTSLYIDDVKLEVAE